MSSWSYCVSCSTPLPIATLSQAIAGSQLCPHCGTERPIDDSEREVVLDTIEERLAKLEELSKDAPV